MFLNNIFWAQICGGRKKVGKALPQNYLRGYGPERAHFQNITFAWMFTVTVFLDFETRYTANLKE